MRQRLFWGFIAALVSACSGVNQELTLSFPSESARAATTKISYLAFVPLLLRNDATVLVECSDIGAFRPNRILDPDSIEDAPDLAEVLMERMIVDFPFDGDWEISVPAADVSPEVNPWGASMVFVEARAEVRASREDGGGMVQGTLVSGCYCFRTTEGTHADPALDQAVKAHCQRIQSDDGSDIEERVVELLAVPPPTFTIDTCSGHRLAAAKNESVSPGPALCLRPVICNRDRTSNCFACERDCDTDGAHFGKAPVLFEVDQPGGQSGPKSQIVLTNAEGEAKAEIVVDDCATPIKVYASLIGRTDPPIELTVSCLSPIDPEGQGGGLACQGDLDVPAMHEPVDVTVLPTGAGLPDLVAALDADETGTTINVLDLVEARIVDSIHLEGESPMAIHGYYYALASGGRAPSRPVLAVATQAPTRGLVLHLYDWHQDTNTLVPHDGGDGTIAETCSQWSCGSRTFCLAPDGACPANERCELGVCSLVSLAPNTCGAPTPTPAAGCGCSLTLQPGTTVSLVTADADGDQAADLAVSTSSDQPIVVYFSSQSAGTALYRPQGCRCGRYAHAPTSFELLNFGGTLDGRPEGPLGGSLNLALGTPSSAFLKYAAPRDDRVELVCGQPVDIGDFVPVRDVVRGRFQCNPSANPTCDAYEDLVVVSASSLGASFDDLGQVRLLFGGPEELGSEALDRDPAASLKLVPRPFSMKIAPKDPRSAQVADFNADGNDDLAVLFAAGEPEVHVWLGAADRSVGESETGADLGECPALGNDPATWKCLANPRFATPDLDADGRAELVVLCDRTSMRPRLRWFSAR